MSTKNSKHKVFFEAPDFGFGPVSAAINILNEIKDEFDCTLIGSGSSLTLARRALSDIEFLAVDTFQSEEWGVLLDLIPPGSTVVSTTNLPFAEWAIGQGYRVGIVDTLFWMWDSFPTLLRDALFYAVQSCFFDVHRQAVVRENENHLRVTYTAPIIDKQKGKYLGPFCPRTAIVGLGGMRLPLDPSLPFQYAQWLLSHLVPLLLESGRIDRIEIIGGLPELSLAMPECFHCDPRVKVIGFLAPENYRLYLTSSEFLFLTPGLATVYETAFLGIRPIFLPGFNMSMILQGYYLGCCFPSEENLVIEWPWTANLCPRLKKLGENDGVRLISEMIRKTMEDSGSSRRMFYQQINQYIQNEVGNFTLGNCLDMFPESMLLPSASDVVRSHLRV